MFSYCLKCKEKTESKNPKLAKTKKWKNNSFAVITLQIVVIKNRNLLKSKEQKECSVVRSVKFQHFVHY